MKVIQIMLPIKPISVNQTLASVNGRQIKTAAAKTFLKEVHAYLCNFKDELDWFKEVHEQNNSAIKANYTVYCPREKYYTQKNKMSLSRGDSGNFEKPLTDAIFSYMGINDAYLNPSPSVLVVPHVKWAIIIELEIIPHPETIY